MLRLFFVLSGLLSLAVSFGQKKDKAWKTNFGIEGGLSIGGITPSTAPDNPLVQGGAVLKGGFGLTGGASLQFIKTKKKSDGRIAPLLGFQLKALYNNFTSMADGVFPTYNDQTIKITEFAVPLLFNLCISSKEADIAPSRDPDKIEISRGSRDGEYEGRYTPGQYHAGYHTTLAVFIYAGPQIGFLNNVVYESGNAGYKSGFESVRKNLKSNNLSAVGGIRFVAGRTCFDISYQKGLQSVYNGADVYINSWIGKFGILF